MWSRQTLQQLARTDSPLGRALRQGLHGLRAALRAALDEASGADPAAAGCRDLIEALDAALGAAPRSVDEAGGASRPEELFPEPPREAPLPAVAPPPAPRLTAPPPAAPAFPATAVLLAALRQARWEEGPLLARSLGPVRLRGQSDAEVWPEAQRLLLRLPPHTARACGQQLLEQVLRLGGRLQEDQAQAVLVPYHTEGWIFPGLTGEVKAPGLYASAAAPHPRLGTWPADPELRVLAGVVSLGLAMTELDANLRHALKDLHRFSLMPLEGEHRQRYAEELVRRYQRVIVAAEPVEALQARLDRAGGR
jgi:hypothetical protein